jgi:hypothetical protein
MRRWHSIIEAVAATCEPMGWSAILNIDRVGVRNKTRTKHWPEGIDRSALTCVELTPRPRSMQMFYPRRML